MDEKLTSALTEFGEALSRRAKDKKDSVLADAISKRFEVALEYAWKACKRVLNDSGIEVYAPKDVSREAGKVGLIENVEEWLAFVNARNLSVHDYLGMDSEEYAALMNPFLREARKLALKL